MNESNNPGAVSVGFISGIADRRYGDFSDTDELLVAPYMEVLLIEDDSSLAEATREILCFYQHTVEVAQTVAEALDALSKAHHFQVILLDLRLGTERGEAVFSELRALKLRYPPVIILSAQPETEIATAAKAIGAVQWISKPVSVTALNAALEAATDEQGVSVLSRFAKAK